MSECYSYFNHLLIPSLHYYLYNFNVISPHASDLTVKGGVVYLPGFEIIFVLPAKTISPF